MNKLKLLLIIFISCIALNACEDDYESNGPSSVYTDEFVGDHKMFKLEAETRKLSNDIDSAICYMLAPDGSQISRKCEITHEPNSTTFNLDEGLCDGEYRLLYLEYYITTNDKVVALQYGLGCRILIEDGLVYILDRFDETMQMSGSGKEDDPYIITCGPHLYNLTLGVKDFYQYSNFNGAYYKQVADISLENASYYCKHEDGWIPIGDHIYPFQGHYDGGGHKITDLYTYQENTCGVGLFGMIVNTSIQNLTLENASICGRVGVGGIAGCIISFDGERTASTIYNCTVKNSTIKGCGEAVSIGGVLGIVDPYTIGVITQCHSENNSISAEYNAGGIVGGSSAYSLTEIDLCSNSSNISTNYSGAGGIIGVADTLLITTCSNTGEIIGAKNYSAGSGSSEMGRGVGGICGGAGISYFTGCTNDGNVSGYEGVGGIVGSTRIITNADGSVVYNSAYVRYCRNSKKITGRGSNIGGICGESQFACISSLNEGSVSGVDYVGGIVGHSSLSAVQNSVNTASVKGNKYISGITALSNTGVYVLCQNYGTIEGSSSNVAGIVGLSGNNTMIHYCANHGSISGSNSPVGGVIGEMGDPREWSPINIAEVVFGTLDIAFAFAGPIVAVMEHAAGANKVIKYLIQACHFVPHMAIDMADVVLWGYGIHHLVNPHHIEAIEAEMEAELNTISDDIVNSINNIRSISSLLMPSPFSSNVLTQYNINVNVVSDYLLTPKADDDVSSNNELVYDKINDIMYERAESIAENNKTREITCAVVGGVSLVVSFACAIAATFFSGGSMAPVAIGTMAGIVCGVSSIVKGAADYTDNVAIVSQCVNTNTIKCSNIEDDEVGGIVGRMHDRGWTYDCLNTGGVPSKGGAIIGRIGNGYDIVNCLSLKGDNMVGKNGVSFNGMRGLYSYPETHNGIGTTLTVESIGLASSYAGWNIGTSNENWHIPSISGYSFPVPFTSEMTKE